MVICKDVFELDELRWAKLVAGRKGLDREVTWVYAKHTKDITPWVHGGEFLMVSGFEDGIDEQHLLDLVRQADDNDLSGILVEGGKNFKTIPEQVINLADLLNMPLFFVPGVCVFRDINQAITELLVTSKERENVGQGILLSLLEVGRSDEEKDDILKYADIDPKSFFQYITLSIKSENEEIDSETMHQIQQKISLIFEEEGKHNISNKNKEFIDYLIYADSEEEVAAIANEIKQSALNMYTRKNKVCISFSKVRKEIYKLKKMFDESHFTNKLIKKDLIDPQNGEFLKLGGYLLIFAMDKEYMIDFRNEYLLELKEADQTSNSQLMRTLTIFLENNGNMLRTAENLFVHRNTLQYRLNKIAHITGKELEDPNVRRDFQNALLINRLYPM